MQHTPSGAAAVLFLVVGVAGCGNDLCAVDAGLGRSVLVTRDEYVLLETTVTSQLGTTVKPEERFPIAEGSRFRGCEAIAGLIVRDEGVVVDEGDFPALRELGSFTGGETTADDGAALAVVDGFDDVTTLGDIGGAIGDVRGFNGVTSLGSLTNEQIGTISGLNSVEEIVGVVRTSATITGLTALRRIRSDVENLRLPEGHGLEQIDGSLEPVSTSPPIFSSLREVGRHVVIDQNNSGAFAFPVLERVGGDLVITRSETVATLALPALQLVGRNVAIADNIALTTWSGFRDGARITGDFSASGNRPIDDDAFRRWLSESRTTVGGSVLIDYNGEQ